MESVVLYSVNSSEAAEMVTRALDAFGCKFENLSVSCDCEEPIQVKNLVRQRRKQWMGYFPDDDVWVPVSQWTFDDQDQIVIAGE